MSTFRLVTERLVLTSWTKADIDAYWAICRDPAVMQFIGDGNTRSRSSTEQFIDRQMALQQARGFCLWAIRQPAQPDPIGFCGLAPIPELGDIEIGWRLAKQYWGMGYATEAANAVWRWASANPPAPSLVAMVYDRNHRSMRVMTKLGMVLDRILEERRGMKILLYRASLDLKA